MLGSAFLACSGYVESLWLQVLLKYLRTAQHLLNKTRRHFCLMDFASLHTVLARSRAQIDFVDTPHLEAYLQYAP